MKNNTPNTLDSLWNDIEATFEWLPGELIPVNSIVNICIKCGLLKRGGRKSYPCGCGGRTAKISRKLIPLCKQLYKVGFTSIYRAEYSYSSMFLIQFTQRYDVNIFTTLPDGFEYGQDDSCGAWLLHTRGGGKSKCEIIIETLTAWVCELYESGLWAIYIFKACCEGVLT